MSLAALQDAFVAALREPAAPVPDGLMAPDMAHRTRRFNVYRNTVFASLTAAVEARFPVVARLVGDEFFRAMAREFIDRAPPSSPVLSTYGAAFPSFLDAFEPVAELPYLADVARLEWARSVAYHARDAEALSIDVLSRVAPEELGRAVLSVHPAARLVRSGFPVASIWSTNTHDDEVRPIDLDGGGEAALVSRPHLDVLVTPVSVGAAALFEALVQGVTLGDAFARVAEDDPHVNIGQGLAEVFLGGAFDGLSIQDDVT